MAKFEYDIDYRKEYPSENISDEVIAFLKESDLKRKYFEYELKTEKQVRKKKNGKLTNKTVIRPSRADSLERLMDLTQQFASAEDVEETIITKIMVDKLRHCLKFVCLYLSVSSLCIFFHNHFLKSWSSLSFNHILFVSGCKYFKA